jgi:hypothetical protein
VQEKRQHIRDFRLIDEALASEPIKNSFRLGWEFITLNQKFTWTTLVIFVLLNILGMIPLFALIFMVLSTVFGLVIQIHIGRTLYLTKSITTYVNEIKESRLEAILNSYTATAFGAYLGWVLVFLIFLVLFTLVGGTMGIINENMSESDLINALIKLGIPSLLVASVLFYLQPLVQSNIVMANSFKEGFNAVFTLFSIDLWRLSLQKSYFKYISIFGLLLMLALFIFVFLIGIFSTFLGSGTFGNILLMVGMYIFMIMMVIGSMMAKRLVEQVDN